MKLIDGKSIAATVKSEIAKEVANMMDTDQKAPHLAAVLVGNDPASETYVASKERACKEVGFISSIYKLSEKTTEKELLKTIEFLNNDEEIDGYIVQLPLPKHIDTNKIIFAIDPKKDVDGFHPQNVGRMVMDMPCFLPATPAGIMTLLERSGIETEGKNCVVLGRSNIVGTPVAILLSRNSKKANGTVTLCHSRTKNLKEICLTADILIAAIGKAEFVTADMVKDQAVVIDVGIHRISDNSEKGYKIVGDVKFDEVSKKCSHITPVPGGVGPMTIVSLLENTLKAAKIQQKSEL
ncbi:MAG: bifunctional methylenetetrahydrofolate dehydrogenase/methenyltetrahydrofolate cyclohydrolase FolD [Bacteroidales bacterium]|nr:bifunctional methylenetetrahydrofolate dehydrogenase/methenyltetrahydrofolate cyclohydrolase FolD [Bacteroidales bacterium]